ncbi:MAG: lycopene cyclase domain-containing protein [Chloroflexota bacterium]|nr:lycopene cyclase domain-containing protein [Dehalococcoidia bacterium]MDW8252560.1 lycopene cyclase domain-containing protein [Chloroflexota bacterium]
MTYFRFLAVFLLPPIALFGLLARRRLDWRLLWTLGALSSVAVAYTTPWDNLIVLNGVWDWDRAKVVGRTIGVVPLEEYCFFILQTLATGLLAGWLARR